MTHVSDDLRIGSCRVGRIHEGRDTVKIITPQAVDKGLDWLQSAFVQYEVP